MNTTKFGLHGGLWNRSCTVQTRNSVDFSKKVTTLTGSGDITSPNDDLDGSSTVAHCSFSNKSRLSSQGKALISLSWRVNAQFHTGAARSLDLTRRFPVQLKNNRILRGYQLIRTANAAHDMYRLCISGDSKLSMACWESLATERHYFLKECYRLSTTSGMPL
jgi:hypothetical protein